MSDTLTRSEIMTPESPRWREFCDKLDDAIGRHGCNSTDTRLAKRLLRSMKCVDVEASVEYFEDHGGYCDCEILLNVDPGFLGLITERRARPSSDGVVSPRK